MRNKLIIGNIPGHKDVSGVLFDFLKKWNRTINPKQLAAFLQNIDAWSGQFLVNVPKDYDGLLDELKIQLLSGAKSIFQFKLFVKGQDYLNPWQCQLEAITAFYQEVFNLEISLKAYEPRFTVTDNFMYFPKELCISDDKLFDLWEIYRNGNLAGQIRDLGLRRSEPIGLNYGVQTKRLLQYNLRSNTSDYILTYKEKYVTEDLGEIYRFSYDLQYKPAVVDQGGITLREAFILCMFEFWKKSQYFSPRKNQEKYLAIPCYGSVCADIFSEKDRVQIPIIILTPNDIQSTWASQKKNMPRFKLAKIYQGEDWYLL
ncbi:MAG: hypothetical protein WC467_02235 [Patescibacteria group bacterium]